MIAKFSKPLRVEKRLYREKTTFLWIFPRTRRRYFWVTIDSFWFHPHGEMDESSEFVPKDFPTDFSSVPAPFRFLFPKDDVDSQAAVMHDKMYNKYKPSSKLEPGKRTRKSCDDTFLLAMEASGQRLNRRRIKYRALRLGGWYGWNKKDKQLLTYAR